MDTEPVSIECLNGYHRECADVVDHIKPERHRKACRCQHTECHTRIPF